MKQTQDSVIYRFSGLDDAEHLFFGAVPHVDDSIRKGYLEQIEKTVNAL